MEEEDFPALVQNSWKKLDPEESPPWTQQFANKFKNFKRAIKDWIPIFKAHS
jgi:hypothetical protein